MQPVLNTLPGDATARSGLWRRVVRFGLAPAALYLLIFIVLTWPVIRTFMTHIWAGDFDGYQMVWNVWWLNRAVTELHQHPWYTHALYHPIGTSLLVHTLHPLKSVLAIPLIPMLGLGASYNTLLIASFVFSGMAAFWLAYAVSRAYAPSLVGGFIYTFSSYHFAHALGHMQLVSMEWLPIFLLLWRQFLLRPSLLMGLGAAATLFAVLMSDHYYFLYSVMAAAFMAAWDAWQRRDPFFMFRTPHRVPLVACLALTAVTSGAFVGWTLTFMRNDPSPFFFGADEFSLDLLSVLLPGGRWRFCELTRPFWTRLTCNVNETSVHLGLGVLTLVGYAWHRRRRLISGGGDAGLWVAMGVVFWVFALGPRLHIAGWTVPYLGDWNVPLLRMPYALVAKVVPGLDVAARPIRMVVMTILCAAVVAPLALRELWGLGRIRRAVAVALLAIVVLEFLPSPVFALRTEIPPFVQVLAGRRDGGAVYDEVTRAPLAMYYQTVHEHPIAYGYVSRTHRSQYEFSGTLKSVYREGRLDELRDRYGFRYLVAPPDVAVQAAVPEARALARQEQLVLYDLRPARQVPVEEGSRAPVPARRELRPPAEVQPSPTALAHPIQETAHDP